MLRCHKVDGTQSLTRSDYPLETFLVLYGNSERLVGAYVGAGVEV